MEHLGLSDPFPPFNLRIQAGELTLRPITDEVLPEPIAVAAGGIHNPALMPFYYPWTDAPADRLPTEFAQYHWGTRARWSRAAWSLEFAVEYEGVIVGTQGFATQDYVVTHTGETGSWLGRAHQSQRIGTQMRQAMCAFVFAHLDAEEITSGAFTNNPASLTGHPLPRQLCVHLSGGDPLPCQRLGYVIPAILPKSASSPKLSTLESGVGERGESRRDSSIVRP